MTESLPRVALVSYGDRAARDTATFAGKYLNGVAEALRAVGVIPEPAIYSDELVEEVRAQLLGVDGVLVWVNPSNTDTIGRSSMVCSDRCPAKASLSAPTLTLSRRWEPRKSCSGHGI